MNSTMADTKSKQEFEGSAGKGKPAARPKVKQDFPGSAANGKKMSKRPKAEKEFG